MQFGLSDNCQIALTVGLRNLVLPESEYGIEKERVKEGILPSCGVGILCKQHEKPGRTRMYFNLEKWNRNAREFWSKNQCLR